MPADDAGGQDDDAGGAARTALPSGPAPRAWGGRQRRGAQLGAEPPKPDAGDEGPDGEAAAELRPDIDELLGPRDNAGGEGEGESSRVVAKLAATSLDGGEPGEGQEDEEGGAACGGEMEDEDGPRRGHGGLSAEEVVELRRELDERLRLAAAAGSVLLAGGGDDLAYGTEVGLGMGFFLCRGIIAVCSLVVRDREWTGARWTGACAVCRRCGHDARRW